VIVDLLPHDRDDLRRQLGQLCLGFDPTQLTTDLQSAGFSQISLRPLPPESNVKGPALQLATVVRS
jgi:ArsR family transcriptional regulator